MKRSAAAVIGVVLLVVGLCACTGSDTDEPRLGPDQRAARAYLSAYGAANAARAAALTTDPVAAKAALAASLAGLGDGAHARFTVGEANRRSGAASTGAAARSTVAYTATWTLPGATSTWRYRGTLPMRKGADGWQVRWVPSDVHPELSPGQHLAAVHTQPPRAALQDSSGTPLFSKQPVVVVGINPANVTDLTKLAHTLASVLQVSAAEIISSVRAAPVHQFVPVITLRRPAYEKVRSKIHDLPGTQFQTGTELLGPTSRFAQPLLGRVGPATKQIIDESHGRVVAGDRAGLSGLQRAFNDRLAGTDGLSVVAVDRDGTTTTKIAEVSAPKPGTPVRLTLDRPTQAAAEAAVSKVGVPAAIVVTEPSSGKILAVANTAAANGDIALTGQYPPGSTFKIVTYTAAFTNDADLTPATRADCPGSIVVNGQTIHNEDSFEKGTISLAAAFAYSCNTTAVHLGLELPHGALRQAARSLGLGATWQLPVDAFSGSLPEPSGPSARNEKAADSYGQGKVLVSPLLMAEIAGAAATGRPVPPSLVAGKQPAPGPTQPARVTGYMNTLMRDVVTMPGATGRALKSVPGAVRGKTGTAEFGTRTPPRSHSWFAGTRGDLAFAVFVYGGGDSGPGAVSLARTLLTDLPR